MPPVRLSPPDPAKLIAAIADLDRDYDKIDDHHALATATRDRRDQFAEAVGSHPRSAELLSRISSGAATQALGVAREILRELQPAATARS